MLDKYNYPTKPIRLICMNGLRFDFSWAVPENESELTYEPLNDNDGEIHLSKII